MSLTLGVSAGSTSDSLRVQLANAHGEYFRSELRTGVVLGLEHRLVGPFACHASLTFAPTWDTGHAQWLVREDALLPLAAFSWLRFFVGIGTGLTFDLATAERSHAELALPLGLRILDRVELVYRPFVALPLAAREQAVFGGRERHSTPLSSVALDFQIRVRTLSLGWGR